MKNTPGGALGMDWGGDLLWVWWMRGVEWGVLGRGALIN